MLGNKRPISDSDIKHYLPDAKIITYGELSKYKTIDELLPKSHDFVIILYEWKQDYGHWTCVLKYDDAIEFFDPLGHNDKTILGWAPFHVRKMLGEDEDYLTELLEKAKSKYKVVINKMKIQNEKANTCGRHVVARILAFLADNEHLPEYQKMLKHIRKLFNGKLNYDEIVSQIINI
jgi:hypothetical protein